MAGTYVPWNPVGKFGCGDPDGCPSCSPMVRLEREAEHRKKVESTYPRHTPAEQVNAWLAEAYGTGADRSKSHGARSGRGSVITAEERKLARAERDRSMAETRVKRTLSATDAELVEVELKAHAVRRTYLRRNTRGKLTRVEWKTEVWLELLNPTALVGQRERDLGLEEKIERAIRRGQKTMDAETKRVGRETAAAGDQAQ